MARLSWAIILGATGLAFANPAQAQTANTAYAAGYAAPYNAPNLVTLAPIQVMLATPPMFTKAMGRSGKFAASAR